MEKLQKEIFQSSQLSPQELDMVFKQMMKALLTLYSFPVDKCRELSIKMVTQYVLCSIGIYLRLIMQILKPLFTVRATLMVPEYANRSTITSPG